MKISFGDDILNVLYVINERAYEKALSELMMSNLTLFGLDIETMKIKHPDHPKAGLCPLISFPRLIQIATTDTVYVFDTVKLGWHTASHLKLRKSIPIQFYNFLISRAFVAHNAVFELTHFTYHGLRNMHLDCSMVMSRSIHAAEHYQYEKTEDDEDMLPEEMDGLSRYRNKGHSLDDCIQRELGIRVAKAMQTSNWNSPDLTHEQIAYAALDAYLTRKLYYVYAPRIEQHGLTKSYNVLKAMQHVIADMHITGLKVDWDKHSELVKKWTTEFDKAKILTSQYFGETNLASSKQMGKWLESNMPSDIVSAWEKTEKGAYSFTRSKLTNFLHLPQIKALSEWKKYQKLLSTYGESMTRYASPVDGRVRTSYSLGQTATARLSAKDINIQNLPRDKEVREIFVASKNNKLIVADFSQIEVRVQAELSLDPVMRGAYAKKQDIYKVFASKLYHKEIDKIDKKERSISKTCYSGDTEVLTPEGWVRFDEYAGQQVAQYVLPVSTTIKTSYKEHVRSSRWNKAFRHTPFSPEGGEIEFVTPTGKIKKKSQVTYNLVDRQVDICATPDHQMYWMHNTNKILITSSFQEMLTRKTVDMIPCGYMKRTPVESNIFTRVLAMTVADGSFNGKSIRFGFVKRTKLRRCIELFKLYGIKASQKVYYNKMYSTGKCWHVSVKNTELYEKLLRYTTTTKKLSWECLTALDARTYLEEAQWWDSTVADRDGFSRVHFVTTVRQTADVMQAMAATSGVESTINVSRAHKKEWANIIRLSYPLKDCSTHKVRVRKPKKEIRDVYCVEVPSGMLLIRRNGKVCVQGNCILALAYGMGATKLSNYAKNAGVDITQAEADMARNGYHRTFNTYSRWCDEQRQNATVRGYATTLLGKRRKLKSDETYTRAPNHAVQGTAAELLFVSSALCRKLLDNHQLNAKLVASVHDEMIIEASAEHAEGARVILAYSMCKAMQKLFPNASSFDVADASIGVNWAEAKG